MKKIFFVTVVSSTLLLGLCGCYKTCGDPFAPNYTLKGACIDLATPIIGAYTGQVQYSVVLGSSSDTITIQITKMDDSHVIITSTNTSYIGDTATVSASSTGYYLTVPAQTDKGAAVSGAGTYFGAPADGVYITGSTGGYAGINKLTLYVLAGPVYETFTGTQQ